MSFAGQIFNRTQVEIKFPMSSAAAGRKHSNIQHQRFKDALRSPKCFNLSQNENEMVGVTVQKKTVGTSLIFAAGIGQ